MTAPAEAESQCAHLESESLVDGIVTDDSDTFLFGATNVYRHMFSDDKYVQLVSSRDIERHLKLTRSSLIRLAYLLGSDYCEGVRGIGIVSAMEILSEWSSEDGLKEFKDWCKALKSGDEVPMDTETKKRYVICFQSHYSHERRPSLNSRTDFPNQKFLRDI
jgi:DNA excision repair protein ERCC-5